MQPIEPDDIQKPELAKPTEGSFYDAIKDVIGFVKNAPPGLSTNPRYLEGFGCDCHDRADTA